MFNDRSRHAVDAASVGPRFRRPLYDSYNFARIVPSLPWLFSGQGDPALPRDVFGSLTPPFDHVAFCFIDAFGWQHVERALNQSRFLRHAADQGVLSKLTSMFPSTTAAHVTAVHTGLTPSQSGVYAWQYYEPALGTMIEPLPYAFLGQPRESLRVTGTDPNVIFPGPSIYPGLREQHGVRSFVLQPIEIAGSTCNAIYTAGAQQRPFKSLAEGLVSLRNILLREAGPTYSLIYWDKVDSVCHLHGPDSEQVAAEVEMVFLAFERILHERLGSAKRTLLLFTADHGHAYTGEGVLLNKEFPDVVPLLKLDRLGRVLAPAGSRRDFFLHVRPGQTDAVCERLAEGLAGRASVYRTADLIAEGIFGEGAVSERLMARVGDVAILPYENQGVWWGEVNDAKVSSHGGLTKEEMEIPVFAVAYG